MYTMINKYLFSKEKWLCKISCCWRINHFKVPVFSCSSANAVAVHEDFSTCYHYLYQTNHQYPSNPEDSHHSWVHLHLMLKALNSQSVCTSQNLTASCDHLYPREDCQALCPWTRNKLLVSWQQNKYSTCWIDHKDELITWHPWHTDLWM